MNILANIEGIEYEIKMPINLKEFSLKDFNINQMPAYSLVRDEKHNFAISKWVSPKRTRSYPFERVYNTLATNKKFTVIPIIKDEGIHGDRDFVQWDTISLMSLLDVYVIFAYYYKADKHKTRENKITNQKFDNEYVLQKINEIGNYHSSALHWNLKEIRECLPSLISKVIEYYSKISEQHNVLFHSAFGITNFKNQFETGVENFMQTSRLKAKGAQNREHLTLQPKEILTTATKATITIKNYLGGLYYLTTDEIAIIDDKLFLIEAKHSNNSKLPSVGDIKDGLLKMILYCNLTNVSIDGKGYNTIPTLKLTSSKITGCYRSAYERIKLKDFFEENKFNKQQIQLINCLLEESKINKFEVIIQGE